MLANDIGPARDWGVMLHGEPAESPARTRSGVFSGDSRTSATARGLDRPRRGSCSSPRDDLDLGALVLAGRRRGGGRAARLDPRPKGMHGRGARRVRVLRPPLRERPRACASGADLAYTPGPVGLKGEYLEGREERKGQGSTFDDLPDQVARGWAASATWLLTGEPRRRRIEPRRPFPHGAGRHRDRRALRGAALRRRRAPTRASRGRATARATSVRPPTGCSRAGCRGGRCHWVRFMGNVVVERYLDPLLAPEPGRRGNYVTLLARAQVAAAVTLRRRRAQPRGPPGGLMLDGGSLALVTVRFLLAGRRGRVRRAAADPIFDQSRLHEVAHRHGPQGLAGAARRTSAPTSTTPPTSPSTAR